MPYNFYTDLSKTRINKILQMCTHDPVNAYEIADTLNIRSDIAREFIRHLMDKKMIYVSDYRLFGRTWARYYMAGNQASVKLKDYMEENGIEKYKKPKKQDKLYFSNRKVQPDIASAWLFNPIC